MAKSAFALFFLLCSTATTTISAMTFSHPGVMVSSSRIAHIKSQIEAKAEPTYSAYLQAMGSSFGTDKDYAPQGPPSGGIIECGSYSKPNYGCSAEDEDAATAYTQAVLFAVNGSAIYGANAAKILDHYSANLKGYTNSNAPLQAAWGSSKWARAAELMASVPNSPWSSSKKKAFIDLLYKVSLPLIYAGSGSNGNWELSMIEGMIGISVFSENSTLFDHAVSYYKERIPAYFYIATDGDKPVPAPRGSPSWYGQTVFNFSTQGVCQETCRDLGHTSYSVAASANIAETAFIQGEDLYAWAQERLTSSYEFHANLILGPSNGGATAPHYVCDGAGVKIQDYPTFEVGYAHYHGNNGVNMPLTALHLTKQVRASSENPVDAHMCIFETFTHGIAI